MKLRALAVFAIVTLLPSSATAQDNLVCVKVGASYLGSRDAEEISESIVAILVENLPEAWSCEYNRDASYWALYGVTVAVVDSPDRGSPPFRRVPQWPRLVEFSYGTRRFRGSRSVEKLRFGSPSGRRVRTTHPPRLSGGDRGHTKVSSALLV